MKKLLLVLSFMAFSSIFSFAYEPVIAVLSCGKTVTILMLPEDGDEELLEMYELAEEAFC